MQTEPTPATYPAHRTARTVVLAICAVFAGACELPAARDSAPTRQAPDEKPVRKSTPSAGPTQSDKLLKFYTDLQEGPFAVIADFEDPVHMEIINLSGAATAKVSRNPSKGRNETGKACLAFRATSPSDELILGDQSATNWHLRRNWREYDLLLLSVFSPVANLQLALTLAAGTDDDRNQLVTRQPLQKGWNQLRLDLAEVAERLALDDLREMRMSVSGMTKPVDLFIDDLLLAANRTDIFGDSANTKGELFVRRSGRRWHVGAGGRFELTFANGQIAAWHDLSRDPYRLRNLSRGTTLGPSLVSLDPETGTIRDTNESSVLVEASTKVIEMNALRAVVSCEWRPVGGKAASANKGDQRATYTIYASGHVFVALESEAQRGDPNDSPALAVGVFTDDADKITAHTSTDPESSDASYGSFEPNEGSSLLFVALDQNGKPMSVLATHDPQRQRGTMLAVPQTATSSLSKWWAHFFFVTGDSLPSDAPQLWADHYVRPHPPKLEIGKLRNAGDLSSGFDYANGCFPIRPEDAQLRWTQPKDPSNPSANVFCVEATTSQPAWVYANHLIHQPVVMTGSGQLFFQLPWPPAPILVEVLWQQPSTTPNDAKKRKP